MRCHADTADIFFFEGDIAVDPVFAEHAAAQEEFVVGFEGGQCFFQRCADGGHLCVFFGREVVEVFAGGVARMDLFWIPSKPAINKAANAKYGLAVGSGNALRYGVLCCCSQTECGWKRNGFGRDASLVGASKCGTRRL